MKKHTLVLSLLLFGIFPSRSAPEINGFMIARWYLDADLVVTCSVTRIDTLPIAHFDTLTPDGMHISYDGIRELYHIEIDSVLRSSGSYSDLPGKIISPEFPIRYSRWQQISEPQFEGLSTAGDSLYTLSMIVYPDMDNNGAYFRLSMDRPHVVILSRKSFGPEIVYASDNYLPTLEFLHEVERKGESFFPVP